MNPFMLDVWVYTTPVMRGSICMRVCMHKHACMHIQTHTYLHLQTSTTMHRFIHTDLGAIPDVAGVVPQSSTLPLPKP